MKERENKLFVNNIRMKYEEEHCVTWENERGKDFVFIWKIERGEKCLLMTTLMKMGFFINTSMFMDQGRLIELP